ncbi:MAG: fibrobacter succinogenes major paralogous domain-containing protein [Bacteroidales bacterium]|nr:fibrobacter succinogenes major paralogous domain-containing protein [Bacteroidales bacterium]
MKNQYIFFAIITTALASGILSGCERDDPKKPDNPLNGRTTAVFNPDKNYGTMADIDGNLYKTIEIGSQTWMAENLRVTHYRNGDTLPNVTGNTEWNGLTTGAYCNYNNTTDLDTIATYGRLYNWYAAADSRGLAPEGWRVPTIADWTILIEYLGGDTIASNKMKEVGDTHWEDPFESDNGSGFTALPGGSRYLSEGFDDDIGFYAVWWTSSDYNSSSAGFLYLYYFSSNVNKGVNYKQNGYSIRLIKETY